MSSLNFKNSVNLFDTSSNLVCPIKNFLITDKKTLIEGIK